jgi:hypothetical protein
MSERRNVLSECPGLGSVSICTCGSVHVKIGPVELTLEPGAFAQSALMFQSALEAMETARRTGSDTTQNIPAKVSRLTH